MATESQLAIRASNIVTFLKNFLYPCE